MAMDLTNLLKLMVEKGISDIHFKANAAPAVRIHGRLVAAVNIQKMSAPDIEGMAKTIMTPEQLQHFEGAQEMDLAYSLDGVSRFRVNVFRQRGTVALSLRVVPIKLKGFADLNLPQQAFDKLSGESRGLILFAGITGAGKTTSMNSFVHQLNESHNVRIITIEDPIEFFHEDVKATIVQREVGRDTASFAGALKHVLRQDPDVVVIGEMRDAETMQAALTAAETGHLVLSTVHTLDAVQTIDRIVDSFPSAHASQVRQQLGLVLKGVVAQRLVPSKDGRGRFPATEVLIVNSLVRRHIMEGKNADIYKTMEAGGYYGMHTFDQDLVRLVTEGKITDKEALENATNTEDIQLKLRGVGGIVQQ
ncbi:MAG: PilT/PilU family type 4a pilus ATPase [Elusimicrobia bacterium]|nr:PilT/PilU family type 4a pilus ATPase [Elusimicrobiota bacterium]